MIGSIIGDIMGSSYEFKKSPLNLDNIKLKGHITDDTILTLATMNSLLNNCDFQTEYRKYFFKNPLKGYGNRFVLWATTFKTKPMNSFGNGAAMRISPIAYISNNMDYVLQVAKQSILATHSHKEALRGGLALTSTIYLARKKDKKDIKEYIEKNYGYKLSIKNINECQKSNATCHNSIPQAIISFLLSNNFEECLKNAISMGGDTDTVACMACSIAEAYYKQIPSQYIYLAYKKLDNSQIKLLDEFYRKFKIDFPMFI